MARKAIGVLAVGLSTGLVFLLLNFLHFQNLPVKVIFYACVVDLFLALLIVAPALYWLQKKYDVLTATETTLSLMLASLTIVLYSVVGPTVIDRSLSIYIVEKLNQRGGEINYNAFSDIFVREYIPEFRLMEVRLTEQFASGTAVRDGECVVLTPRGRFIAQMANAYRRYLLPRKRDLMGKITSELTNPFDNARQVVDVSCKRAAEGGPVAP